MSRQNQAEPAGAGLCVGGLWGRNGTAPGQWARSIAPLWQEEEQVKPLVVLYHGTNGVSATGFDLHACGGSAVAQASGCATQETYRVGPLSAEASRKLLQTTPVSSSLLTLTPPCDRMTT